MSLATDIKKAIKVITNDAKEQGRQHKLSFKILNAELAERLSRPAESFLRDKADIKAYAQQCLQPELDQVSEHEAKPPRASTSKERIADSESDSVDEPVKKKRKKAADPANFKSKEFVGSDDVPFSGEVDPDDTRPQKRPRKSKVDKGEKPQKEQTKSADATKPKSKSKSKLKKKDDLSPDEQEIERLKEYIKACGCRFLTKEIADMSSKQAIKHLKQKLADLGMSGRLSLSRAKEIKSERELAKETADLLGDRSIDIDENRQTRGIARSKKPPKIKRAISDDEDEEESDAQEAKTAIKANKRKDKQTSKNADNFARMLGLA